MLKQVLPKHLVEATKRAAVDMWHVHKEGGSNLEAATAKARFQGSLLSGDRSRWSVVLFSILCFFLTLLPVLRVCHAGSPFYTTLYWNKLKELPVSEQPEEPAGAAAAAESEDEQH